MILNCQACGTRYRVDEQAIRRADGRTVRCANCGHTWHQPPVDLPDEDLGAQGRLEPALEMPPRPSSVAAPSLEVPRNLRPGQRRTANIGRSWAAIRWLVLAVLFAIAILAGVVVARGAVVAVWPPAARLFSLAGLPVEPPGAGLKIEKLAPARTPEGLIIEGDITNTTKTTRNVPQLRVELRDPSEKQVQFKIVDPPKPRLAPGSVAHFKTPFDHPDDAATGVVVTFVKR